MQLYSFHNRLCIESNFMVECAKERFVVLKMTKLHCFLLQISEIENKLKNIVDFKWQKKSSNSSK